MTVRMTNRTVPGVGVSQQFALQDGHRLSVVTRRDGAYDLTSESYSVRLEEDEADAVAGLLGSAKVVTRLRQALAAVDALLVEQLSLPRHSPFVGRPLSDAELRRKTGASIVAVLREEFAQPSPKPDFVLEAGDLVVTVGTREALDQVGRILDGTG